MIKKIKETLSQMFFSPEAKGSWKGDDITVNMDGGVGGSWKVETQTSLLEKKAGTYAAPVQTPQDPWFVDPPKTEKQIAHEEVLQKEAEQREEQRKQESCEPDNIHQLMYELATKNSSSTVQRDPIGGSENFQGGSENIQRS